MEKNNSTNGRLSFALPNAESTMNGTFHWGRKEFCNNTNSQERKTTKNPNRNVLSKIEAKVYTDVQSRGLASRIVKYHENSARLNRSMSMNNLCQKSSPLSLKHASKQPELAYKATKQNFSMTHIAPPDKSLFYGNTLSGLLRSNSVITLQQNDDDLSSENRPIIHPPGTENEFQPNVLEVLKEISRKRINNEVLQDGDEADTTKKYCSHNDTVSNGIPNEYRMQQMQLQTPTTYKRQRESSIYTLDVNAQHAKSQQSDLPSPEQKSKRRHCNYNNDIASSLSSSAKSTTFKRKLNEHDGYKRQEKLLRYQTTDMRLNEISNSHNYNNKTSITDLSNTPQTDANDLPLPAIAEKSFSTPATTIDNVIEKKVGSKHLEKPRLTLFNKNYETKRFEESELPKILDNEDDGAYIGINFVKPKKSTTSIGGNSTASSLLLKRTQKSKLALMLSGLRGELYLGEEHESVKQHEKEDTKTTPTIATALISKDTISNTILKTCVDKTDANSEKTTITSPQKTTAVAVNFITPIVSTTTANSATKITSPLTGIKLTPITKQNTLTNITPTNAQAPSPALNTGVTISTTNNVVPTVSKPTFSFGLPTTTTSMIMGGTPALPTTVTDNSTKVNAGSTFNLVVASVTGTQTKTALPTATTTTMTALNTVAPTSTTSAITPVFSFTPKTQANTLVSSSATTPFTFGGLQTTTKPPTTVSVSSSETAKPQFNFTTNKNVGAFNFGNTTTSAESSKTNSLTAAATKSATENTGGGFTFGNTKVLDAKTNSSINLFGGSASSTPKFGEQSQQHKDTTVSTNTFLFGGGVKPLEQAANPTMNTPNNQIGGLFNSAPVSTTEACKTSNTFSFSNVATQPKTFNFGGSGTNEASTEATKSTNLFASLGNNQSQTFSFGGGGAKTNATTLTTATTKPGNTFSFGSGSISNSIPIAATATTTTEAQKTANTFSFSSATQENAFANNKATTQGGGSTFVFGNNKTTIAEPAKPTNVFGASTNQSGAFTFGAIAPPANSNTFGGGGSVMPSTGAFNFNTSVNNKTFATNNEKGNNFATFGSTTNSSGGFSFGGNPTVAVGNGTKPTPTTFGTSTNNTSSGGGGGFVFGASNKNPTPASTNIFGSSNPSTTTSATGNLFGGSGGTNIQATGGNAFGTVSSSAFGGNFTNATNISTSTPPPPTAAANIFTIPPSAGNDRPIRRATRRLAKS